MYHAQQTRLGYSGFKKSYKSMGMLLANIFIRTWIIGEKSFVSMRSRCYDGTIRTMDESDNIRSIKVKNLVMLTLFESTLIIGVYFTSGFKVF